MNLHTIANILGATSTAVHDGVQASLSEAQQGETSCAALVHLHKYPDETIEALRAPLGLSHSACVRLVDRLAQDKLVERRAGADARSVALRLTSKGHRAATRILALRGTPLLLALQRLTHDEQQELGRLTSKVLSALVATEESAARICRLCDYDACPDADCPVGHALEERCSANDH